jgi:hypothetical protein
MTGAIWDRSGIGLTILLLACGASPERELRCSILRPFTVIVSAETG